MSKLLATFATKDDLSLLSKEFEILRLRVNGHDEDIESLRELLNTMRSGINGQSSGASSNDIILLRNRVIHYFLSLAYLINKYRWNMQKVR